MTDWRYFKLSEFECKCGCRGAAMDSRFVDKLDALREELGVPMIVTSGYRCPEHNARVSSTGREGPHTTGHAADVLCFGKTTYRIVGLAPRHGMEGIGLHQRGDRTGRYIHLDDLPAAPNRPRPWVWTYA